MKDLFILIGIAAALILLFAGAIFVGSRTQQMALERTSHEATGEAVQELPVYGSLPEIEGISGWINSEPLSSEDLEGHVVLVDFMTYSCINCIRTFPYVADWWEKYEDDGLIILGMHTPEFGFEKIHENVVEASKKYNLQFPIGLDNDFVTWRNFNNRYWPAKYLFDQEGRLRYYHFGEGKYDETEAAIQQLLSVDDEVTDLEERDYRAANSPETYFGWWRAENFASPEGLQQNAITPYSAPDNLSLNQWSLAGSWSVQEKYSEALESGARFAFRFNAGEANLVMATSDGTLQDVVVYLNGEPVAQEFLGAHVVTDELGGQTFVQVEFSDLYELINGEPGEYLLEIETLEPGLQIYAITFG